jgi:ribonuclease P/MRP protein subunit RPP40
MASLTSTTTTATPTAATASPPAGFEDDALEILEWLDLLTLQSPRLDPHDKIDPYLCRYALERPAVRPQAFVLLNWRGFLPAAWIRKLFLECM